MRILYVEPFEGGSHASFTRVLTTALDARWTKLTLPGRHWKWRMRGSAAWVALEHAQQARAGHDLLLASSYVPLAELVGLLPSLSRLPRVLYFHENQLEYPSRPHGADPDRDHHFGFTQLVSCLAATRCVFNSAFNRDSLLSRGRLWLSKMPDARPAGWLERIAERSDVIPVPLRLPPPPLREPPSQAQRARGPLILWNHRWEHDKNPEDFFEALRQLAELGVPFRVAVCGQSYSRRPPVFDRARGMLGDRIVQLGSVDDRDEYEQWLARADIAVSTAMHEFFGIAMIEAAHFGARPLVPDRLSYPEVFEPPCRYHDLPGLVSRLRELCTAYVRGEDIGWPGASSLVQRFGVDAVVPRFARLFESLLEAPS